VVAAVADMVVAAEIATNRKTKSKAPKYGAFVFKMINRQL